jgi:hypothetical protein
LEMPPSMLNALEEILYGSTSSAPRMPTLNELMTIFV